MFCDGNSNVRSLLQHSTHGPGSEKRLLIELQLCALNFSTPQTVENVSVHISQHSPVSTLLLSCVPGGEVKSSEVDAAIIEEGAG